MSLLAGLDSPQGGEILFRGENIEKEGYSKHRRDNISLVFQNYNLIEYLTPLENIRLVNKHASEDILLELGLDRNQIKRNVLKLSGGQQHLREISTRLAQRKLLISSRDLQKRETNALLSLLIARILQMQQMSC